MISSRYKNDHKPYLKLNKVQTNARNSIEKKIKDQKYIFESICCQVCNSSEFELLSEKDRYGLAHQVVLCKKCGLIYTNPRMTKESYNDFYNKEYRRLYLGTEVPKESYFHRQYKRAEGIYGFIAQNCQNLSIPEPNVLEIGCGAGGILLYFKQAGCNILGVDLDSKYIEYGRENQGLNIGYGSLKDVPKDFEPDIVIYSHVLEHILDINSELKLLKEKCKDSTIIYIEVPGVKNIHDAYKMDPLLYFQNAHTYHFTLTTLSNLFRKHSLDLVYGNEFVSSIFSIGGDEKNREIENDYFDARDYIMKIEKKRFMYPLKPSTIRKKIISIFGPKELKIFRSPSK